MLIPVKTGMKISAVLLFAILAGCSSKVANTSQYSGFLGNYADLKPARSPGGHETLRWISPDYDSRRYQNVYAAPVVYYPAPSPNARVNAVTLEQVRLYTEQRLKGAIGQRLPLVQQPQKGGLLVKAAITAVSAENKDMQFYEVVPVAAVVASTMAATGHRTQNTVLLLEAEAIDVATNQPVIKVVRKGYGKNVANSTAPISAADVKQAIDEMVADVVNFPQ
ncbi:DUF3313 domain-containing protein [Mixta gaviniae]|nr:DUF3313 domain-containing protein [Mixta gaviniae]